MFDPYHQWLGIPPNDQPPTHYRLLALAPFEQHPDVIAAAADRQTTLVRQHQSGEHAAEATRLLNELARARLCLLKPATKTAYDAQLRDAVPPRNKSITRPTRIKRLSTPSRHHPTALQWLLSGLASVSIIAVGMIVLHRLPRERRESVAKPPTEAAAEVELAPMPNPAAELIAAAEKSPLLPPTEGLPEIGPQLVPEVIVQPPREPKIPQAELAADAGGKASRNAVPTADRQHELSALLRNYDLGNLPGMAKKQEAVRKLAEMSQDASLTSDERYVVLQSLVTVAAAVGDADIFLSATDAIVADYEVDRLGERTRLLTRFLTTGHPGKPWRPAIERAIPLAQADAEEDRYPEAITLLTAAEDAVRKSAALDDLKKNLSQARLAVVQRQKAWNSFEAARMILAANTDDLAANFDAGNWQASYKRDWPRALPFLLKGDESDWKAAATMELAAPTDGDGQIAVANAWFAIGQGLIDQGQETAGASLLVHAGDWYENALPKLTSVLTRQTVTDRLAMIAPLRGSFVASPDDRESPAGHTPGAWIDLLAWAEGMEWASRGIDWNANLDGSPTQRGITLKPLWCNRFPLPAIIDGNYELVVEFTRLEGKEGVNLFFPVHSHNVHLEFGIGGEYDLLGWIDGKRDEQSSLARRPSEVIENNRKHEVRIRSEVEGDTARFRIDLDRHKPYLTWEGRHSRLLNAEGGAWKLSMVRHLWIGAMQSRVRFDRVRIRMLSGTIRRDSITAADREREREQGFVRLAGMNPSAHSVGWAQFLVNQVPLEFGPGSTEQSWPRIRHYSVCEDYYGAHAPSLLRCPVPKGARSFSTIGYSDSDTQAKYLVCFDGKVVYDSGATDIAVIKVDIPAGATSMELVIDPAGDKFHDRTYWCYPRFHTVASGAIEEAMLDGPAGPLPFTIAAHTVGEQELTHNQPIRTLTSVPLKFRDALACDEFLFAHAPSTLIYEVPAGMTRFTAIGFNTCSQHTKFEVWAEGKRIYESPQAGITPIDVKLPSGIKNIALKVNSLGEQHHDLGFWCYPRFSKN